MTAAPLTVIVEGPTDANLLRAVLRTVLPKGTQFFVGGGKISLATLGRNVLVHEGGPVLIVLDSDSLNPQHAQEQCALTRLALRNVAPGGTFDVFAFVPEIEVAFFESPVALQQLVGHGIPEGTIELGLRAPKHALKQLSENGRNLTFDRLDREVVELLANGRQLTELRQAVETLLGRAVAA